VCEWYEPIALQWRETQFRNLGEIHLIVDGAKIGFGHQMLMVCLTHQKRIIPIVWTWIRQIKEHGGVGKHPALLAYVRKLITSWAAVFLVSDC